MSDVAHPPQHDECADHAAQTANYRSCNQTTHEELVAKWIEQKRDHAQRCSAAWDASRWSAPSGWLCWLEISRNTPNLSAIRVRSPSRTTTISAPYVASRTVGVNILDGAP